MNYLKLTISYSLLSLSLTLSGQILNGSFEEWGFSSGNMELPLHWDALLENSDSCITKSSISIDGIYSLKIASLNLVESSFGPAYIGTKFKPINIHNKIKFQYLIDSISGPSYAVIELWQLIQGEYELLYSEDYNKISSNFQEEEIDFNILSLDTLLVVLIAKNHKIIFGYDGFISVLFDKIEIETPSAIGLLTNEYCKFQTNTSIDGVLDLTSFLNYKYFKLFSLSGQLMEFGSPGIIINLKNPGFYFLILYDFGGKSKIVKIINL